MQNDNLLPQHKDLGFHRRARPEQVDDNPKNYSAEIQHPTEDHPILRLKPTVWNLRQEQPEIGWGDFEIVKTGDRAVLGVRYDWRNNSVLFLHNLAQEPREIEFHIGIKGKGGAYLINLLTADHSQAGKNGKHRVCLEGYGYHWYRMGGLDYLLKRTEF